MLLDLTSVCRFTGYDDTVTYTVAWYEFNIKPPPSQRGRYRVSQAICDAGIQQIEPFVLRDKQVERINMHSCNEMMFKNGAKLLMKDQCFEYFGRQVYQGANERGYQLFVAL